jgi:hypothetical protein
MLHSPDFAPPPARGLFADLDPLHWSAKWAERAYTEGLLPACSQAPLQFCPDQPLTRGLAALAMAQAKELLGPRNKAPTVDAGPDLILASPGELQLTAAASDDGLPAPPAALSYAWSQQSGPAQVGFSDPAAPDPTVSFPAPGTYTLRLQVSDGALHNVDFLQITVRLANATVFPGETWQTATPAQVGLDQAALDRLAQRIGGQGVVIRDGYLVKTWGDPTAHGEWASASKPLFSTLLFFAIQEGRVANVDTPIVDWGWDLRPKDRTMTFRHLANMVSGYGHIEAPGQAWAYNDYAIKLYGLTLFERVYGTDPRDMAAVEALYSDPSRLGLLRFEDGQLFVKKKGLPRVNMSPRDFARVGWFWLNRGNWNGTQLLSARFFDRYLRPDVPAHLPLAARGDGECDDYLNVGTAGGGCNQRFQGPGIYGFNWWFNGPIEPDQAMAFPAAPADLIMAIGHDGKEVMVILPSLRIVVAARGDWGTVRPGSQSGLNESLDLLMQAIIGP